jgi:hypothetical protein
LVALQGANGSEPRPLGIKSLVDRYGLATTLIREEPQPQRVA